MILKKISIVEDEPLVREELALLLTNNGYEAIPVTSFEDVTAEILETSPDLVLLDINLPNKNGYQICRELKNRSAIPIVILTSKDQLADELNALELGADEFITKPYRSERLLLRVSNVLRRYEGRSNMIEGPNFLMDRNTFTLYIDGDSVILPKNQGKILETLLVGRGEIVTKEKLCEALWGTSEFIDENALQVNLTRLKKTMSTLGMSCKIDVVRGQGYRFEDASEAGK